MQTLVPRGATADGKSGDKELDDLVGRFRELQQEHADLVSQRRALAAKVNENSIVHEEMGLLTDSDTVFKMIGPVLVRQELAEATSTVKTRMDMLKEQLSKHEGVIEGKEKEMGEVRTKIQARQAALIQAGAK